ncbi:MAG TPA: carboxypeptidase regulatory-like domain-containing protein [Vicinamibacterales bacterium]|nr:carboxypeptidase regulatory-like domain-containing protein [Vicinamibacterales bacterium]
MRLAPVLLVIFPLAACSNSSPTPAPSDHTAVADPAAVGTVTGQIVVDGTLPPVEMIRLDADPKCAATADDGRRPAEHVVPGEANTLQNVFIYVKDGLPPRLYPVPATPVVLDQQQCRYVPRVFGIQVGQQLTIRNSDALLHNVRSESAVNEPFDIGTPIQGMEVQRTFATREVMVPFKCNVHAWMHAYAGVLEHPFFAVSDHRGRFSIGQLPPGTYTIEIWHERFGRATQQITVAAQETTDLMFSYKAT